MGKDVWIPNERAPVRLRLRFMYSYSYREKFRSMKEQWDMQLRDEIEEFRLICHTLNQFN